MTLNNDDINFNKMKFSDKDKSFIIEQWKESEVSQKRFCKENNIPL